jgi:hypothetical protein
MRAVLCLAAAALFAISALVFGQSTPLAKPSAVPIVSYAYIGSDTGKITAFAVMPDGSARSVPGSPFSGPSMSLNVSSGYLFASDLRFIATYTRAQNGSLRLTSQIDGTAHNPSPDSAVQSLTLDRSGASLYAGELYFDGGNNAYAFFGIGSGGRLRFLANSEASGFYSVPLSFSQSNKYAYHTGCRLLLWTIFGDVRSADGRLTAFDPKEDFVPPNPTGDILCPGAIAASAKGYLALDYSPAFDGAQQSLVTYRINTNGTLNVVPHSAFVTQSTGFSELRFDPSGTFLAAVGRNGLSIYRLLANGRLAPVGFPIATAISFGAVRWDNFGHVFALSSTGIYIFDSSNGVLMPAPGSPHPIAKTVSLAVLPVR